VVQDSKDNRVPLFTLASKEETTKLYYGYLQDPYNGIDGRDTLGSVTNIDLIAKGATPGGPDDIRDLGKGREFFAAQGKDIKDIDAMFAEIEKTDEFSEYARNIYNTTVFLTSVYKDLKPQEP
jgi:hypothetical protein